MDGKPSLLERGIRGGVEGLAGTAVMTIVIALAHRAGLLTTPPPKQIADRAATKTGVRDDVSHQTFTAGWLAAHAGYGAASGVLFTLVRRWLPKSPAVAGVLYGGALWATSYLGVMPVLGLYPWPRDDRPSRVAAMIGAHFVYGGVTAVAEGLLSSRKAPSTLERIAGVLPRG